MFSPFSRAFALINLLALAAMSTSAAASVSTPHPELWPTVEPAAYPKADAFVEQLLAKMTVEEKVGQMIQADIASITPAELATFKLGSILAGGNAAPHDDVRSPPRAWLDLTRAFHKAALLPARNHVPIPILFGIDAVHGHAKIIGATVFPHNVGLGAAHDPELIRRIGEATAQEVAATGIDWTFAPTVAVARDVRWGRSYESYSEAPDLVAAYAAAMVSGLQGTGGTPEFLSPGHTLSSPKHFLGDGGTQTGRDQGETVIDETLLSAVHGAGYPAALKAGALIVMASYNSWNGVKMHGNRYLLTDVLKQRMEFSGFVVGDWNAHEQLPGCTKSRCAAAILAGVDMLMAPDSWRELYKNTLAQVRAGEIPLARIDDAVRRILRVKSIAGLFDDAHQKQTDDAAILARIGSTEHRVLAREAVRKSLVLLKNDRATLPLDPHVRVLVAGDAADSMRDQTGGWTIDWQGDHNVNADFPGATTIFAGIQAAVARAGGSATLDTEGRYAVKPDVAIVVFGEAPYAEFHGDRETLDFSAQDNHGLRLLRRFHAQGVRTVAVFLSGRPLWMNPELNAADAFVAAWLPGSEGEGVADVLFRSTGSTNYDFAGRLAFSWPATAMPIKVDSAGKVSGALFDRGYGLTYQNTAKWTALSEDPQVPAQWQAPVGALFHDAHPVAPWSIFVSDAGGEVHLTTRHQDSPQGAVQASVEANFDAIVWSGAQRSQFRLFGRSRDLRAEAARGGSLTLRYRVDRFPDASVKLGMNCAQARCGVADATLDVGSILKSRPLGTWQTLSIPLACLAHAPATLDGVEAPLVIETSGHLALSLSEVKLVTAPAGPAVPCS